MEEWEGHMYYTHTDPLVELFLEIVRGWKAENPLKKIRSCQNSVWCKGVENGDREGYLLDRGGGRVGAWANADIGRHGLINYLDTKAKCRHIKNPDL